jgi:hypothetical protein
MIAIRSPHRSYPSHGGELEERLLFVEALEDGSQ